MDINKLPIAYGWLLRPVQNIPCYYASPRPNSVIEPTEEEIRFICELVFGDKRMSELDIADMFIKRFGFDRYICGFSRYVRESDEYTAKKSDWDIIKEYKPSQNIELTVPVIEKICELLSQGYDSKYIAEALGTKLTRKLSASISGIRTKKIFTDISSKYPNIDRVNKRCLTEEQVSKMLELYISGMKGPEIAKTLGMTYDSSFATTMSKLKKGIVFQDVYKKYEKYLK